MSVPDVDCDSWSFQKPRQTLSGGLTVYVDQSKSNNKNPQFQLPVLTAPFGISQTDHLGNDLPPNRRRNMELDVDSEELRALFDKIDSRVIRAAHENSMSWFKKELSEDDLRRMMYRSSIQENKNGQYKDKLRVKVTPGGPDDKRATRIYVCKPGKKYQRNGKMEQVTKGSRVQVIVDVGSVWFAARQFGISLVARHILVWPNDDDEDEFPFTGHQLTRADDDAEVRSAPAPGAAGEAFIPTPCDEAAAATTNIDYDGAMEQMFPGTGAESEHRYA